MDKVTVIFKEILVLSFILVFYSLFSQNSEKSTKPYFIPGARINYGFIIAHTKSIEKAAKSNPIGLQFDFNWHFHSEKAYNYSNCYPRLGLSIYYWDYMNNEILGQSINILGFAEAFIKAQTALVFLFVLPGGHLFLVILIILKKILKIYVTAPGLLLPYY